MTADQGPTKDQTPPPDENLIAMDELDRLIADHDPEFRDQMQDVAGGPIDANIELLDLDQLLAEQAERSLRARARRLLKRARVFVVGLRATAVHLLKEDLPQRVKTLGGWLKSGLGKAKEAWRQFGFKPLRFRLLVLAFIAICAGAGAGLYFLFARGLPESPKLFVQSLEEWSEAAVDYDPATQQEPFYDSVRAAQNVLELPKLVVNLKRTPVSGPNPMMAAEFYLEGNSPDVVLEIKARETEFRDVYMRAMEEFTAEELDTVNGKGKLLERLAREANRLVTKGRVRKVLFKTVVLKP